MLGSTITSFGFNAPNRFYLNILGAGGKTFTIGSSTVPGTGTSSLTWTAQAPPSGLKKFYRPQNQ